MKAPQAEKRPWPLTTHNHTRIDPWYWLRDDERSDPQVLDYLRQENDWCRQAMTPCDPLRQTLYEEMIRRIPPADMSVPYVYNGYRYQSRYEEGQEYAIYCRQPREADDEWRVLLDGNQQAAGHEFYQLGMLEVSPDNRVLAQSEDFLSRRQYDIRFRDLRGEKQYPEVISQAADGFEWAADSGSIYYVRKHPQTLLPYQVYQHVPGSDPATDRLVFEEADDRWDVSLGKTTSERYIIILLSSTTATEIWLLDAAVDQAEPVLFIARRQDHEYLVDHYQDCFYLRSNRAGKNFGLYRTGTIGETDWETLVAPHDTRVLESFALFRDWLVLEEREQGLVFLRQIHWQTRREKTIRFSDPAWVAWLGHNPEPDTSLLRYGYSSMTTPSTLFELDLDSGRQEILKQSQISQFSASDYASERLWINARDGVQVPVSLVYRRDSFRRGDNPLLVYGYGAYGISMEADFSASRLSLLDRGFVFAIAHIRGGGELGQQWYDAGRLFNKMNTFNDFIDASQALIAQGYGHPQRAFAMGGSAGGLLMGGVINMAPELFKGVVAQVPFVDVLTTMLDASIPLTTGEYEEWGNPQDPASYDYILQYSPIDGVKTQSYPHLLVTTGLHDSQVQYWEPAKWVAKLREAKTDDHLLLLYTDMEAGHGGKSGRFKYYEDIALEYAFLLMVLAR
ncbi:prolyl oligopeptidase family serine peptidase [Affinibrenneria salicis]|uniref:Prolyl oligopeptidase family serine peptidase n=2 Tax=Affinibrenneria salicis TaxID=2590031 RepID=A0A5J5G3R7_9GAMM|nr:prolyl oligopeptidase family serine peptidase [Affinibrenneria salicis]